MGVITISLKDKDEQALRQLAEQKYGKTKGAIAKTITDVLKHELGRKENAKTVLLDLMKNAKDRGGITYKSRDELYD